MIENKFKPHETRPLDQLALQSADEHNLVTARSRQISKNENPPPPLNLSPPASQPGHQCPLAAPDLRKKFAAVDDPARASKFKLFQAKSKQIKVAT